jgi:uroporphyrinogen decarboxylase
MSHATTSLKVPLAHPAPDAERFIRAVTTAYEPPRPPLVEYILDRAVMEPVLSSLGRPWVERAGDRAQQAAYWDNYIAFWRHMGYDYVRLELPLAFTYSWRPGGVRGRPYEETARGPVASWEAFERYPWPQAADVDFWPYEYVAAHLPDGMGLCAAHACGPFEVTKMLMGYETLCLALHDAPDLVAAVVQKVGSSMLDYYRRLLQTPRLLAVWPGDDMGFRSGTLLSPADLRRYFLPWHRRFAELAHAAGLPYFLHSCGHLAEIMDHLIDDVGVDAKHSFEDAITPAAEFKRRYAGRLGVLGGVDIDVLARSTPDNLRRYVRRLIDACAPGGRFALGSGNSIPDYIPVENYLTMIDEALA